MEGPAQAGGDLRKLPHDWLLAHMCALQNCVLLQPNLPDSALGQA